MNAYKFTHAHPPTPPEQGNHSSERMTTIDFQLRGLHGMDKSQVTDIYCPQVRRSRFHEEYSVNHLDVVSCWKRLSLSQATEVINWERLFCDVLEVHISDSVRDSILASSTINGGYLQTTRFVEVELSKLVHDMIGLHFAHKPDWQYTKPWFMSNSDLPAMVYNFLRTRDCFIETSPQPCVQLDFVCSPSLIIGEVIWQPPNINFGDIPRALSSGSLYSVQPDYHSPDLGNSSGPRFASFPDDVSFTADSQSLLLEWECAEQSITAIVPSLDDIGRSTKTMFTIKSVIQFPGGVRYERISRYNIRLLITNRETNILYQPIKRKAVEQFPISSMFDTTEFFEASRLALDSLDDECLEFTAGQQRLLKQICSETSNVFPKLTHEKDISETWTDKHLDDLGQLSTTCVGEAQRCSPRKKQPSPHKDARTIAQSPSHSSKSRAYTSSSGDSRVMPALRQKGSVKRMVFRRGATYESQGEEDQESVCDDRIQHSGYDLDQNAICDNYIEFCRKRLDSKRDMDRTEETQVFERIFMEGSANSSSSVIGSDEIEGMSSGAE